MDVFTFFASVIDSLAWPAVVIAATWMFRGPLSRLMDAITNAKLRYAKGGATLEAELNTAREKAVSVPAQEPPKEIRQLSKKEPLKAIEQSWKDLEMSASAATAISVDMASPLKVADTLIQNDILTKDEAEAFYKLYEIRESTAGPLSVLVADESTASGYTKLAYSLSRKIEGSAAMKGTARLEAEGTVHRDRNDAGK